MSKVGVLLINLGTPDDTDFLSVYRYLTEFLNDPRVIDLPYSARFILTNLCIVPLRCKKVTHAYQKIMLPNGLPLFVHTQEIKQAVAAKLNHDFQVEIAMRYGNPSIATTLQKLQHCTKLIAIPLFPHYSSAATGSAIACLLENLKRQTNMPSLNIINQFYDHEGYIRSYAEIIKNTLGGQKPERILFSYHGLPERHINKSGCKASCDRVHSCPPINEDNAYCYRAQCFTTSHLLAKALNLSPNDYQTVFQSRLGRTPWIRPYTDTVLTELRQSGIKRIAIVSPSFVVDCLETLEELNIRAREQWLAAGGEEFIFIPCLNAHPTWIEALTQMILKQS